MLEVVIPALRLLVGGVKLVEGRSRPAARAQPSPERAEPLAQ
jgi:hypothetical protein